MQLSHQLSQSRGAGLIEVLMAMLIIAIGVLGMAGLQSRSLQSNQAAYIHSRATILAGDMLDRIRTNHKVAKTEDTYQVSTDDYRFDECTEVSYPDSCESDSCKPEEIATYDIQQWKFHLACELPGAGGAVSFSDVNGERVYTIRLSFPNSPEQPVNDLVLRGAL